MKINKPLVESMAEPWTLEYDANDRRADRIAMYRKYASLKDDEIINESNLDEDAIKRTAWRFNCDDDRVRDEVLGKRWSEYEI